VRAAAGDVAWSAAFLVVVAVVVEEGRARAVVSLAEHGGGWRWRVGEVR
jgi:hypothetical protein